jgi:hypothetical protein
LGGQSVGSKPNQDGVSWKCDVASDSKEKCKCAKQPSDCSEEIALLNKASKYKRVNSHILAFGFSDNTKELFWRVEKDKEELVNDEEFDLLKWFFGSRILSN